MVFRSWTLAALLTLSLSLAPACRRQTDGLGPAPARPEIDASGDAGPGDADARGVFDGTSEGPPGDVAADLEAGTPDLACATGATRCSVGPAAVERCLDGDWQVGETCPSGCLEGRCLLCTPDSRRCSAAGTGLEECKKDGSSYTPGLPCPEGCQAGTCNVCRPAATTCTGTTLRTCNANGQSWDEHTCKPPVGGGGLAACTGNLCDVSCLPGRTKMGEVCACPMGMVDCGGACVPAVETIEVPPFQKKCALPISDTCDPYNLPILIQGCAKQVEVTLRASAGHCAPIYLQMLANGMPKGPRSAAIPPGGVSMPLNLGPLGPGAITLGFVVTVAREGCGVGGLVSAWDGSAKVTLTVH